ncbi:hypothetical protein [Staphylococcus epidermidis]|jgi:hypothetical protein|uniref:hypothetical protein n=1 Tax=Staphylococcus epidermidis TaxID=1282 RepID=UPI002738AB6B|nr:hypothetical protein [Staphylococcus epidermidis]
MGKHLLGISLLSFVVSLDAHAFSSLLCRNEGDTVRARLTFDGNGQPLVFAGLAVDGRNIKLDPETIRPGKYPMRHTGTPMRVKFVGYELVLAEDDQSALVSEENSPTTISLVCCDPNFPQCRD